MSDLVAFLLARLDEEYEVAEREYAYPSGTPVDWSDKQGEADSMLVGIFSPARVLAEVAAKRLQIDMTFRYEATIDGEWGCCHEADSIARGECPATPVDGIRMLRLLALPYAEHSGYRSEWSPDE